MTSTRSECECASGCPCPLVNRITEVEERTSDEWGCPKDCPLWAWRCKGETHSGNLSHAGWVVLTGWVHFDDKDSMDASTPGPSLGGDGLWNLRKRELYRNDLTVEGYLDWNVLEPSSLWGLNSPKSEWLSRYTVVRQDSSELIWWSNGTVQTDVSDMLGIFAGESRMEIESEHTGLDAHCAGLVPSGRQSLRSERATVRDTGTLQQPLRFEVRCEGGKRRLELQDASQRSKVAWINALSTVSTVSITGAQWFGWGLEKIVRELSMHDNIALM